MEADAENIDVVDAVLQLAAEDDAVRTRATVPLPVQSYVNRVEKLVNECSKQLESKEDLNNEERVAFVYDFIINGYKYKLPIEQELISPYRTYFHNVLAQRQGNPASLACLLYGVLERIEKKGLISSFEVVLAQRGNYTALPSVVAQVVGGDVDVATPKRIVGDCLYTLKRFYWPWEWSPQSDSGFLPAAEALVAAHGRVGKVGSVVGVMQGMGRPFGDLTCARMATSRLADLEGGHELRDLAVLLAHDNDSRGAYDLCQRYMESDAFLSLSTDAALDRPAARESLDAFQAMITKLERDHLEASMAADAESK